MSKFLDKVEEKFHLPRNCIPHVTTSTVPYSIDRSKGLEYRPSFREVAGEDFVIRDQSLAQRAMNMSSNFI
ncbi:3181_t:CDS:2 [Entrophospora sp. SA101]|nr:3181_t:CDS:2 [Entrophospora sp. SA101]